jgi:hypothetical protein
MGWMIRDCRPPGQAAAVRAPGIGYNLGFDSTNYLDRNAMEAERINALSALLNDLTDREAELRRYL